MLKIEEVAPKKSHGRRARFKPIPCLNVSGPLNRPRLAGEPLFRFIRVLRARHANDVGGADFLRHYSDVQRHSHQGEHFCYPLVARRNVPARRDGPPKSTVTTRFRFPNSSGACFSRMNRNLYVRRKLHRLHRLARSILGRTNYGAFIAG